MLRRLLAAYGYHGLAIAAACCTFLIARANALTFPYPWNDEARFFLPAWWLSSRGSLSPAILNAPHGIFWVPDGFCVWLAAILSVFGRSVYVARSACEITVALGVGIFALVFRKVSGSLGVGAAISTVLIAPPTILAANMIRMEAPMFLIFALAMLLHVHGRRLACASMLLLSLLFHPAFLIALPGYCLLTWVTQSEANRTQETGGRITEWLLFAIVAIAVGVEVFRIAHHFPLFRQHMALQTTRKMGRSMTALIRRPQGILLYLETLVAISLWARLRSPGMETQRSLLLPIAAATLGVQIYAVSGGEMMYDVYSLAMGPALFLCLACCLFQRPSVSALAAAQ